MRVKADRADSEQPRRILIELTHERTLAASAKCKLRGSCHDCAMTCPHGNNVVAADGSISACGDEVFDKQTGNILICLECRAAWGEQ